MGNDTGFFDREFPDGDHSVEQTPEYSATVIVGRDRPAFSQDNKKSEPAQSRQARDNARTPSRRNAMASDPYAVSIEDRIIGSSPQISDLRNQIMQYAPEDASVCIIGESGVGKELVAQELHRHGRRNDQIFLPINAGAIPETLATAELFGHQKGSFTGAHVSREGAFIEANGGTLYLDEIGEMPASIQAQILRVLDDGKVSRIGSRAPVQVDIRLITATNRNLRQSVADGKFRRDLYYRINVLPIFVPSLRDRGDDVIEIAEHLIKNHDNPAYRDAVLTPRAIDRIRAHEFPGNVRELRNLIMRAVVHARGGKILPDHLLFDIETTVDEKSPVSIGDAKRLMGKLIAAKALSATEGNVTKAAELTGLTRSSFHKLKQGLEGEDYAAQSATLRNQLRSLLEF